MMREVLPDGDTVTLTEALQAFGWTCGPEFEKRYLTDPWVFNLANAVQRLTEENRRLSTQTRRPTVCISGRPLGTCAHGDCPCDDIHEGNTPLSSPLSGDNT